MSFGFKATNPDGVVMADSETPTLHYYNEANRNWAAVRNEHFGGLVEYEYEIDVPWGEFPVPFFQLDSNFYRAINAIIPWALPVDYFMQRWTIRIIERPVSADANVETQSFGVFCFLPISALDPSQYRTSDWDPKYKASDSSYGIVLRDADGNRTFDSRLRPLSIATAVDVEPPDEIRWGGVAYSDQDLIDEHGETLGTDLCRFISAGSSVDTTAFRDAFTPYSFNEYSAPYIPWPTSYALAHYVSPAVAQQDCAAWRYSYSYTDYIVYCSYDYNADIQLYSAKYRVGISPDYWGNSLYSKWIVWDTKSDHHNVSDKGEGAGSYCYDSTMYTYTVGGIHDWLYGIKDNYNMNTFFNMQPGSAIFTDLRWYD